MYQVTLPPTGISSANIDSAISNQAGISQM